MKKWIKDHKVTVILMAIMALGIGLLSYPSVADWWNSFHQSRAVASYASSVAKMDTSEYDKLIAEAEDYNKKIADTGVIWNMTEEESAEYESILDITGTGIMGYIDIPKINVQLPIYHGTDESVLQIAIGHIAGSSLPIGGKNTHCIVSGHRGLPSAKLFTDIDKMTEGDVFTMTVLDRTVTYEVDQIRIVEPTNLSDLQIVDGKDYCTLVTCTPYGINTHRLLVRGHRIKNLNGDADIVADGLQIQPVYVAPFIALPILIILIVWMFVSTQSRKNLEGGVLAELLEEAKEQQRMKDLEDIMNQDKK